MNVDSELEAWRQEWQSQPVVPLDLRKRVERQTRFMKLMLASDAAVTLAMGGAVTRWAVHSPQPDIILLAVVTWLLFAAAWTFTLKTNRGKWAPSDQDTAAFVDLALRRCRGKLAALRFAVGLFVVNLTFSLTWIYHHNHPPQTVPRWLWFSSRPIDIVWICAASFFVFMAWLRKRNQAEREFILNLRNQLKEMV